MAENQLSVFIDDGTFAVDDMEKMRLHGDYYNKIIRNKATLPEDYHEHQNINCQAVYVVGNVLIRQSTENIEDLMDIFIRYTHDPCVDLKLDMINHDVQMISGTICPKKKTLFSYNSKVFVAYGRYIFGYDKKYTTFQRLDGNFCDEGESGDEESSSEEEDSDDEDRILDDKITNNRIILKNPDYDKENDEYVYSFCIYDQETKIIDAFGLYR